jgi:hypothetical protein
MWRRPSEAALPELAGDHPYAEQIPLSRALPMWAGIGAGGFAPIFFHSNKKMTADEWVPALQSGKLRRLSAS